MEMMEEELYESQKGNQRTQLRDTIKEITINKNSQQNGSNFVSRLNTEGSNPLIGCSIPGSLMNTQRTNEEYNEDDINRQFGNGDDFEDLIA